MFLDRPLAHYNIYYCICEAAHWTALPFAIDSKCSLYPPGLFSWVEERGLGGIGSVILAGRRTGRGFEAAKKKHTRRNQQIIKIGNHAY